MSFLVVDRPTNTYIFTAHDPRQQGFSGSVKGDVSLVHEFPEILDWPHGERPEHWLGVSERDDSQFRVFPSPQDCQSAGYRPLSAFACCLQPKRGGWRIAVVPVL